MAKSDISNILPNEFLSTHELLLYYNDIIVDLLHKADELGLSSSKFQIKSEQSLPTDDEDFIEWMFTHGFETEAYDYLKSHLFFSLLRDFIFYMHESFDCAERGKVTVAYTISRKPIKDTLYYLCWLLVDNKDLLDNLMLKESKEYDISSINFKTKKRLINEAVKITKAPYEKDFIFDLIYKRNFKNGLSKVWDQSLHLVTGSRHYPTEPGNLNFIFAYDDIWDEYWSFYYATMPIIMNFSIEVIIKIFESIAKPDSTTVEANKWIRNFKFLNATNHLTKETDELFRSVLKHLTITCEKCQKEYQCIGTVADEFINDYLFTCPHCEAQERVGEYFMNKNK